MRQVVVGIGGMSCQNCVKTVTRVLEAVPGVEQAVVSLEAAQVTIRFDPEQTGEERFRQAIEDAGFDAE